jgi:hypothetical protein
MIQWLKKLPLVKHIALSAYFDRLALGYDVARGFIHAQDSCLGLIEQLAPSAKNATAVREEILKNKSDTYKRIELLRHAFPEVIIAIETRAASRSLLNRQRTVIQKLIGSGLLDRAEADRMLESVNEHQQSLRKSPTRIPVLEPETLLSQVPWLESVQPATIQRLLSIMDVRIYAAGEVLLQPDQGNSSLVLIVRGAVAIYRSKADREKMDDILGPGTVLGIAALRQTAGEETVQTRSPVEALWFDAVTVQELMQEDKVFAENLTRMFTG